MTVFAAAPLSTNSSPLSLQLLDRVCIADLIAQCGDKPFGFLACSFRGRIASLVLILSLARSIGTQCHQCDWRQQQRSIHNVVQLGRFVQLDGQRLLRSKVGDPQSIAIIDHRLKIEICGLDVLIFDSTRLEGCQDFSATSR